MEPLCDKFVSDRLQSSDNPVVAFEFPEAGIFRLRSREKGLRDCATRSRLGRKRQDSRHLFGGLKWLLMSGLFLSPGDPIALELF